MSTRIAVLFVAAMAGVFAALGVVAASFGPFALVGYLVGITVFLLLIVRRARAERRARHRASGRTCQCCTSSVFDPVEIV